MVVGNVLCALNLASSVMLNGVCCYYEMQREEERKKQHEDIIRRAIRTEWDRERHVKMLQRQQQKETGICSSRLVENSINSGGRKESTDDNRIRVLPARIELSTSDYYMSSTPMPHSRSRNLNPPSLLQKAQSTKNTTGSTNNGCSELELPSLFDEEDDSDDEEFEEVSLT